MMLLKYVFFFHFVQLILCSAEISFHKPATNKLNKLQETAFASPPPPRIMESVISQYVSFRQLVHDVGQKLLEIRIIHEPSQFLGYNVLLSGESEPAFRYLLPASCKFLAWLTDQT
jgi:hypothetical protein